MTTFPPPDDAPFATVTDLLENIRALGLPHFQRGAVWDDADRARLLESLYYDTPCGTIILWRPEGDIGRYGASFPVGTSPFPVPKLLVLDGQQRLSALWQIFAADASGDARPLEGLEEDDDAKGHRGRRARWCVNLVSLGFKPPGGAGIKDARSPLFVRTGRDSPSLVDIHAPSRPDYLPETAWEAVRFGLDSLKQRRFNIVTRYERDGRFTEQEMVALYNRINSAGRAVQDAEKAYAAMVSLHPGASAWLERVFAAAHPAKVNEGRSWLRPQRERRFGFGLFVRAFVQAASQHLNAPTLDLKSLTEAGGLAERLRVVATAQQLEDVFGDTERALSAISTAIRDEASGLACDDFRFSPPIDAVRVCLHLLLKYPDAPSVYPLVLPALLLRLTLADTLAIDPAISVINRSVNLGDALQRLGRIALRRARSDGSYIDLASPSVADVEAVLSSSQSFQSDSACVLYWLQRRRGAVDPWSGRRVAATSEPQGDHTVPYSMLAPVYGIPAGRGRPQSHAVHRLGNLMWIGGQSNFEKGADPALPVDAGEALLQAHYLMEGDREKMDSEVLRLRDEAVRLSKDARGVSIEAQQAFDAFCGARLRLIASDLSNWLGELGWPTDGAGSGATPFPQRIVKSPADRIRARAEEEGWETGASDILIRLLAEHSLNSTTVGYKDGEARVTIFRTAGKLTRDGTAHVVRLDSDGRDIHIGLQVAERELLLTSIGASTTEENPQRDWFKLKLDEPGAANILRNLLSEVRRRKQGVSTSEP